MKNIFDDVFPADGEDGLLWNEAVEATAEVMDRFADKASPTRALAIALRQKHGRGKFAVRHRDGKTFVVPREQ
ncbi:MAG: hypothetical protein WD556_06245 [Actinomycetota bacterium]